MLFSKFVISARGENIIVIFARTDNNLTHLRVKKQKTKNTL